MRIKNIAPGGRGIGVAGVGVISWAPGEVKDVADDVIAKAKKDPANAGCLTEEGGLVLAPVDVAEKQKAPEAKVSPRVTVQDEDAKK